jgi:PAS domain S-box-containing protein
VGGLAEARSLTEDIVEAMREGLVAADRRGRVLMMNGEARRLLGLPAATRVEGRPVREILPGPNVALIRSSLLAPGESQVESQLESADGKPFPVEVRTSVLRGRKGRVRGAVLLLRDLTLKRTVDAAVRRIAKLEELTELARGIAHEVRNPLASMCGCAEEIAREPGLNGPTRRLSEILVREALRVDGIIDDFLCFARIRKLRRTTIVVGELLSNAGILLQARTPNRDDQQVLIEAPSELIMISGDHDLLTQLLLNVGINALEALGGRPGEVRLSAQRKMSPFAQSRRWDTRIESGVEIAVTDTGCGFEDDEATKIFNPFYSRKARGTGLGLTIAHRIVRMHGGTISVASTPDRGSTFRIWLPGAEVVQPAEASKEVDSPREAAWT